MSGEELNSLERADTSRGLSGLASEARRGDALGDDRLAMAAIKARLFPTEAAPATIGRFTVLRPLGVGGMSVVYAAYDERLDRRIAVKLLRADQSADSQARLLREAQAMARLSHPNVVAVHEVGTWEGQVYIAMEFVRGANLREWLQAVPRDISEIREVFVAAGRGLAAAHRAGLVHRDFKPANVLVGDDGRVRVGDFGLVRRAGDAAAEPGPEASMTAHPAGVAALSTTLTATGAILGTPAYMSPEQHLGRPADARSDQFSLCVALYEALYGAPPFHGDTVGEIAERVLAGAVDPVPEDSKVPAWLRRVVLRGLAVDPDARWPTIDDLLDELGRDPERVWRTRRNLAIVGLSLAALVVGLGLVARERGETAAEALRAEAVAERQRRSAVDDRTAAEAQRDRALATAETRLAEAERARAALEEALASADEQRRNAEAHAALAEHALAEAERRRKEAEGQRKEAERQTTRAVQEATRARDTGRLAQALAGARGDPTTVLALLREVEDPAAVPGWVPAAVQALLQPVSAAVLRGHRGALVSAAFSPDGRRVATAGDDHLVTLWSWSDDHVLQIHEHAGPVRAVLFGPDGALLTGAADGAATLWRDPPLRREHGGELRALALSPEGRTLVTAGADGRVRAWDLGTSGAPRELARHDGPVHAVHFDPAGQHIVSVGADGTARVVDLRGGPPRALAHASVAVRCAAFSPDGRRVATGAQDGLVRVWDAQGAGEPRILRGHGDEVVALAWSPGGDHLASASLDRSARVWSSSGAAERSLTDHTGRVYALAWSPDGDRLVTASQDGTARVWPIGPGPEATPIVLRGHAEAVVSAAFSPDGDHVVSASRDGNARVWRVRGGDPLVRAVALGAPAQHLAWADALVVVRADGRALRLASDALVRLPGAATPILWIGSGPQGQVLAYSRDGELRRWDAAGLALPGAAARAPAAAAALTPDGRLAALADEGGAVLVDMSSGTRHRLAGHAGSVTALAFSPDGQQLATGGTDRVARLFSVAAPRAAPREFGPHSGSVTALAFSPDGRRLATGSWDRRVRVWDLTGAAPPLLLEDHSGPVRALAWRPDGAALASASDDASARIWPLDGRSEPVALTGHGGPVRALAWSPAGDALASTGDDGRLLRWSADLSPGALQARLRAASPVCLSTRQRLQLLGEPAALADATSRACQDGAAR